jgi:hypothetical protein
MYVIYFWLPVLVFHAIPVIQRVQQVGRPFGL